MTDAITADPYAHHPELRGKIADPLTSFFRTLTVESIIAQHPQMQTLRKWAYSDTTREGLRAQTLQGHTGDLWVFAYGSLMWDPAFQFAELRRAHVPTYARRFILVDDRGGRGTKDEPGLMAALDKGDGCQGLAFRIAAADVDTETEVLWRRELIGPGYIATFVTAQINGQPKPVLTFIADHTTAIMHPHITRAQQIRYIATGKGILGTSKAYLENIVTQFALLGIVDPDCTALLSEVEDYLAAA
jgi:glutathione-specific gamma-glutamylcyclotransferase